ncbi:MAG: glycosyltransferase [Clostridiales bacterium]|nr:glycosyltransferase [Clostridiales bacterium]
MTVSVCMLTYQHEDTVAQAIESVLRQKTDFPYELIIGDDRSTDGTPTIIRRYLDLYGDRIRFISQPKNVGPVKNAFSVLRAANGEYLAFLEGDDFWTSDDKLQLQVDYLRAHPDCSMVYHACDMIDARGDVLRTLRQKKEIRSLSDMFPTGNIHMATSSITGINLFLKDPSYFRYFRFTHYVGDIILKAAYLREGSIGYIDAVLSCYRKITSGKANYSSLDLNRQRIDAVKAYRAVMYLCHFQDMDGIVDMQMKVYRDIFSSFAAQKRFFAAAGIFFIQMTGYERRAFLSARKQGTV